MSYARVYEVGRHHSYTFLYSVSSVPKRQHKVGKKRDGRQRGRDSRGYHQVHPVLGRTHLEGELERPPIGEYDAGGYGQHHAVPARHN